MTDSTPFKELTLPRKYRTDIDTDIYNRFLDSICADSGVQYAVFHFSSKWTDLLKEAPWYRKQSNFSYFWEQPADSFAIAANGKMLEVTGSGSERFQTIHNRFEQVKNKTAEFSVNDQTPGLHLLGGFSFFDEISGSEWDDYAAASFVIPTYAAIQKNGITTLSVSIALPDQHTPEAIHRKLIKKLLHLEKPVKPKSQNGRHEELSNLPIVNNHRDEWTNAVMQARSAIKETPLEKVVLARQLKLKKQQSQHPALILHQLRTQYPNCVTFYIQQPNAPAFIGCSPEKLLSFHSGTIQTEALAGSIGRGKTEAEDNRLAKELLASSKNMQEHDYVVRSIKQGLSPLVHNLTYTDTPVIKKLANVQHLYTPLTAQKRDDVNPLSLLSQLHPTPAVGGFPRGVAEDYIRRIEPFKRGWFASPVGWMNSCDEGEFTVAIRSGLISETEATLFAGCGIVADSDPDIEWQETNLKFIPMLSALNYD